MKQVQGRENGCVELRLTAVRGFWLYMEFGNYGNLHGVDGGEAAREKRISHVVNLVLVA